MNPTECERRGELRDKVVRGVAWNMAEKIGTALMQMAVSLIILRLLTRADLGLMAILTAVSAVALVIVDSGFSQTLIRKPNPQRNEFTTVFLFNIGVSLVLYTLFVAVAPAAARYYDMPELVRLAPVFFLLLPVNALCAVQNAIFTRQFRFALLSKVTFVSWLVSGLTAIGLALAGCGVWSIVAQRVLQMTVRAVLLWWVGDWRPRGAWDGAALRRMAPYSFSLMATDLFSAFYNKVPQFFLGRLYPADVLGAFDQAVKLKDQPVVAAVQSVQNVTFPALSKIGDDPCRFAESYRQIVMIVAYVLFPVMIGLSAIAPDLFAVLLGEEWMQTVPYFEVICLAGLCYPVAMIAFTVLKVRSDGGIIVRTELLKKGLMTLVFLATIPVGVQAVVWGLVVIAFCEMAVNVAASMRFTVLRLRQLFRTLLPVAIVTAVMYGAVRWSLRVLPFDGLLRLLAEIGIGAAVYVLLSAVFRLEAFHETVALIKKFVSLHKGFIPDPNMKEIIQLHDKKFRVMIPAEQIDRAVSDVADRINTDYGDKDTPIFLGILNGSFMFMSDLIKKIEFNNELSFVKLASYEGDHSTGEVKTLIGLNNSLRGRHIIIVEDIVETGNSIAHMVHDLAHYEPASVEVCTLFYKPACYCGKFPIKYRAMEIGNEFIVGYGLDYNQLGRSLKDIYVVTE